MSQYMALMALVNNDTTFKFSITLNGAPLSLSGYTPKVYQKATAQTADSGAIVYQVGTGLTVVNSALGQLNWTIPHANAATTGTQWWHLDLVDGGGNISSVFYGQLVFKAV
jgi:hypothetical protein